MDCFAFSMSDKALPLPVLYNKYGTQKFVSQPILFVLYFPYNTYGSALSCTYNMNIPSLE